MYEEKPYLEDQLYPKNSFSKYDKRRMSGKLCNSLGFEKSQQSQSSHDDPNNFAMVYSSEESTSDKPRVQFSSPKFEPQKPNSSDRRTWSNMKLDANNISIEYHTSDQPKLQKNPKKEPVKAPTEEKPLEFELSNPSNASNPSKPASYLPTPGGSLDFNNISSIKPILPSSSNHSSTNRNKPPNNEDSLLSIVSLIKTPSKGKIGDLQNYLDSFKKDVLNCEQPQEFFPSVQSCQESANRLSEIQEEVKPLELKDENYETNQLNIANIDSNTGVFSLQKSNAPFSNRLEEKVKNQLSPVMNKSQSRGSKILKIVGIKSPPAPALDEGFSFGSKTPPEAPKINIVPPDKPAISDFNSSPLPDYFPSPAQPFKQVNSLLPVKKHRRKLKKRKSSKKRKNDRIESSKGSKNSKTRSKARISVNREEIDISVFSGESLTEDSGETDSLKSNTIRKKTIKVNPHTSENKAPLKYSLLHLTRKCLNIR